MKAIGPHDEVMLVQWLFQQASFHSAEFILTVSLCTLMPFPGGWRNIMRPIVHLPLVTTSLSYTRSSQPVG